jgi:hypothetical protein
VPRLRRYPPTLTDSTEAKIHRFTLTDAHQHQKSAPKAGACKGISVWVELEPGLSRFQITEEPPGRRQVLALCNLEHAGDAEINISRDEEGYSRAWLRDVPRSSGVGDVVEVGLCERGNVGFTDIP